ncbi:MAG: exodeoxyribonuclease VII large subunit, partial [Firmicutes bacterium]|nr:exodeoxyribonuclease VII large subunit [Bacillota bacterium]
KEKLGAEGLFAPEHKKPIPEYPKTVAVITSPTGAAVRDIINVAGRRNPAVKLVIVPVLVQGENAAADIARGIELVNEWGGSDTIIVGRGGGSMEDLWAFNEEIVARAIFASEIPVISAVGHEVDFTIADFVSDHRAPTPSAAAELAVPASQPFEMRYKNAFRRINTAIEQKTASLDLRFKHAINSRHFKRPLDDIFDLQIYVGDKLDALKRAAERKYDKKAAAFDAAMTSLEALSPLNVLKRGYALAYSGDKLVKSVKDVGIGEEININVKDGSIKADVRGITNGSEKTKL